LTLTDPEFGRRNPSALEPRIGHYVRERCSAGTGVSALELCCRRDHFML
jgi:hypothetical protein